MMHRYVVYNEITGNILRVIEGMLEGLEKDLNEGELFIEIERTVETPGILFKVDINTKKLINRLYPFTTIQDVYSAVNGSDILLNSVIENYLQDKVSIAEWKLNNYNLLRYQAYPSIYDYADAQTKLSSLDPDVIKEGQEQLDKYLADSLAVKERFPKPVV